MPKRKTTARRKPKKSNNYTRRVAYRKLPNQIPLKDLVEWLVVVLKTNYPNLRLKKKPQTTVRSALKRLGTIKLARLREMYLDAASGRQRGSGFWAKIAKFFAKHILPSVIGIIPGIVKKDGA